MLPSPRFVIMLMLAAPMFLAGALYNPFVAIGALYVVGLGLYAVLDLIVIPRRGSVEVERVVPERLSLAEPAVVRLRVRNLGARRVKISFAEDLPEHLRADPPAVSAVFDGGAEGELQYRLIGDRRGRHFLSRLDVRVLPQLGLFFRQFSLEMSCEVHVFPNLVNLKRYELQLRRGLREQGLARMRQIGMGTTFESLRHYTYGDEMSRVDWKATAKRGRLIVRNHQPERQQSVLICLDCGRATAGEFEGLSRLDYLVNAALMFAYVVLRQGDWLSLMAFSGRVERYLPPFRGVENIDRVARALYTLETRLEESDYGAACRFIGMKHRKRSLICVMSDVIDREASAVIIGYMARFARYHLPLAVALENPEVRAVAARPLAETDDLYSKAVALDVVAAREEALETMRRQGVSVLSVSPALLTPELINRYLRIKATRRL